MRTHWIGLGLAAVVAAGVWSLAVGGASMLAWQAERSAVTAPDVRLPPDSDEDPLVRDLLGWARLLDPGNPDYGQRLGQRLERAALKVSAHSRDRGERLTQARASYLEAARGRPTWPLSLVPILRIDLRLGHLGPGFARLYRRTSDLGRSEPAALRALVDLGLVAWPTLDAEGREAVSSLLAHGLRLDPRQVLTRAAQLERGAAVLPLVAADPRLLALYREILPQSPTVP